MDKLQTAELTLDELGATVRALEMVLQDYQDEAKHPDDDPPFPDEFPALYRDMARAHLRLHGDLPEQAEWVRSSL